MLSLIFKVGGEVNTKVARDSLPLVVSMLHFSVKKARVATHNNP